MTNVCTAQLFAARTVNKTAFFGQNVRLTCNSSSDRPVVWWFKDQLGTEETEVVVNGKVVDGNVDRMTLVGHDLVIHNAFSNDTGMYTCVENYGFGEHHKIFLRVLGD